MKKLNKKTKVALAVAIPILIMVFATVIAKNSGSNFADYKQGLISLDNKEYSAASYEFGRADYYKDAEILESYCEVMDYEGEKSLETTLDLCKEQGKSLDKKYVYEWACMVSDESYHDFGYDYFVALGDYKDSKKRVAELNSKYPYYFSDIKVGSKTTWSINGFDHSFTVCDIDDDTVTYLCDDYGILSGTVSSISGYQPVPDEPYDFDMDISRKDFETVEFIGLFPDESSRILKDDSGKPVNWLLKVYRRWYTSDSYYYVDKNGQIKLLDNKDYKKMMLSIRPAFTAKHHVSKNIQL